MAEQKYILYLASPLYVAALFWQTLLLKSD